MNVILEKDGQQFEYKVGPALYLLLAFIPFGSIVVLVMQIMRKQFRGISLNQIIIAVIAIIALIIVGVISFAIESAALLSIAYLLFAILNIYILVTYVLNANAFSVKQRLEEGFRVVNMDNAEVAAFVQKAEATKVPFFQITKF